MEVRRRLSHSGGATDSAMPSGDASGTHLRSLQALLGSSNAERLKQLKDFVVDKGPELLGDLFSPWAKWTLILLSFLDTDGSLQRFIASIIGTQSPDSIKSPLQMVVSTLRSASEEALQDAKFVADWRIGAVAACRAIILILIMAVADLGWKGLVFFHAGFFVAHMTLPVSKVEERNLFFQAVHVFLWALDAVAPTLLARFVLPMVGSVFAISLQSWSRLEMNELMVYTSAFVIVFLTPFWFGVCVLIAIFVRDFATDGGLDLLEVMCMCIFLCCIRLLVYASGGGLCGALLVFIFPVVVFSGGQGHDILTPLPLVSALLSCLFTSFWVGLRFTSLLVVTLAAANDNTKAILWWFVSFAALHLISYAFSRNSSVIIVCFIGSYFSYGL